MSRLATNRRTLLLAAVLISSIALALLLWKVLPISCPSQPEWWMVGC